MSWQALLLILVISSCHGSLTKRRQRNRCFSKKDCVSCVTHITWFGSSCHWCPRDNKCRAQGALKNRCPRSLNVVKRGSCSSIVHAKYDPTLAYKMVLFSAVAYADNVSKYLPNATEVNTFCLVKQVTKLCPGANARCSCFTAVSHTEKAIVIAFRGSETLPQVIYQFLHALPTPNISFQAGGKIQSYFHNVSLLIWNELKPEVYRLIKRYPSYKVWVTGHSLGGALASVASAVIAYEGKTRKANLILYTSGQPRVGNYDYALAHDKLVPISFRVNHYRDPIPRSPTCHKSKPAAPCLSKTGGPYHHGKEIFYGKELMGKYSSYKECNGLPYNEDRKCSNNISLWKKCIFPPLALLKCINDHFVYFGIVIGDWWKSQ